MSLRALLLGSAALFLVAIGPAAAQTGSFSVGGSATGSAGAGAGGTAGGTGSNAGSAPTLLLPEGGAGSGSIQRSLSGPVQQGGGQRVLDSAGSALTDLGTGRGPIATTPTPLNAPSAFSADGGAVVLTPTPRNAPAFGSSIVPPMFGTGVPPLSGDSGLGIAVERLGQSGADRSGILGGLVRSDGRILSASEAARLQQQLRSQQQTGPQIIVLSGSVFQGTTDRPNVVAGPTGRNVQGQLRGLSTQTLSRGQPVLQGTVEAPRVIALSPSPGNVLVVQGGQIGNSGGQTGTGQIRAQIVEVPAE